MNVDKLEKDIVKMINAKYQTKFKVDDLMEWATQPVKAEKGEKLYQAGGYYCAFKEAK